MSRRRARTKQAQRKAKPATPKLRKSVAPRQAAAPRKPRLWIVLGLVVIGGAGAAIWALRDSHSRPDITAITTPPNPDTSRFEMLVARRIRERRAAVAADPRSASAWGKLGMVFDIHNLTADALVCYAQAERLDRSDFRWPYMQALCMPEADPARVIETLRRARSLRPDYPAVNLRLGFELLRVGRDAEARPHLEEALAADARNSHALLGLAHIAFNARDFETARRRLERAVLSRPDHGEAYRLLARAYRALEMPRRAQKTADKARALPSKTPIRDPARTEVVFEGATVKHLMQQAGRLRRGRQPERAIQKLRQALQVRPTHADAHFQLGAVLFFDVGRWTEGLPHLQEALRLAPNHQPARRALDAALQRIKASGGTP